MSKNGLTKKTVFMQGNQAILEGALAGGARFYAGYPITPSSEVAEQAARRLPAVGGTYIQMEDEIASMAAIIGASLTGVRSFTATSGPGFSLMQENLGMAVMTEVPCVVINVQRSGPSTGLATKPAQADVMQSRWGTHGDHSIIVLCPSSVSECHSLTMEAFDLADAYRTPVIVLADEIVGHMLERAEIQEQSELSTRPGPPPGPYLPYAVNNGKLAPLASFGGPNVFRVTSSMHGESGFANNSPENARGVIRRLYDKIESQAGALTRAQLHLGRETVTIKGQDDISSLDSGSGTASAGDLLLISYGASARTCLELAWNPPPGLTIGHLNLNTLWPFPERLVELAAGLYDSVMVVEMNLGQVVREVRRVLGLDCRLFSHHRSDGQDITPGELAGRIKEVLA